MMGLQDYSMSLKYNVNNRFTHNYRQSDLSMYGLKTKFYPLKIERSWNIDQDLNTHTN